MPSLSYSQAPDLQIDLAGWNVWPHNLGDLKPIVYNISDTVIDLSYI